MIFILLFLFTQVFTQEKYNIFYSYCHRIVIEYKFSCNQ